MAWYASWSGGADSTATILVAKQHGLPLAAAVYCEIMFTKDISAEVPEHRDFVYETAIPKLEQMGVPVIVLRSENTALEWMLARTTKGKRVGKIHGFPLSGNKGWCSVKRDCKLPPLDAFRKTHPDAMYYEGICADEINRIDPAKLAAGCYPLVDFNYTQEASRQLCKEYGLSSPIYEFCKRGGCFFCPNASDAELRHLRKYHPDLWGKLMEIQLNPEIVRPGKFRVEIGLQDLDAKFAMEENQISFFE